MSRRIFVGLQCLCLCLSTTIVRGADVGWDGDAADNLWSSADNWTTNAVPGLTDSILLTGTSAAGPQTIDLGGVTQRIDNIQTNGVSGTYTFTNGTLELFDSNSSIRNAVLANEGGGGMVIDSDLLFAVAAERLIQTTPAGDPIVVNGDISTSAPSGTMTVNLTNRNLSLDPAVQINGVISDGAGARIALTGGFAPDAANHRGVVAVTGANTFTGPTRINGAILEINSIENVGGLANSLGQPALADSTISIGTTADADAVRGTLRYVGSGHTTDRDIQLAGKDDDSALIESSGSGPLVLNGNILNPANGQTLLLGGTNAGNNLLSGTINPGVGTDITSLRKVGVGKWTLTGDSPLLDGSVVAADGEFVLTGSIGSTTSNAGGFVVNNAGEFTLDGGYLAVTNFSKSTNGTLNFNSGTVRVTNADNASAYGGPLIIGTAGAGTLQLQGGRKDFDDVTLDGSDDSLEITGGVVWAFTNLDNSAGGTVTATTAAVQIDGGVFTHRVDTGTASIDSLIQGTGGFTKQGAGTLEFTSGGQHTYSGPTRIEGGTLRLVGSNGIATSSPVFIAAGASLDLVGATGGDAFGPLTGAGTITTADTMGVQIFTNGQDANFGGEIIGAGNLTKSGLGKQTLSGANTYTGPTAINANGGTLEIATGGSIVGTSNIALSNATFTVNGGTVDTPGNIRPNSNAAVFNITGGLFKASAIDRTVNSQYLHQFNWTGGTVHLLTATVINGSTLTAINRPFAASLTIDNDMHLIIDETFSVTNTGTLNLNGGSVTVDNIITGGNFNFNSGSVRLRNNQVFSAARLAGLDIDAPLDANRSLTVDGSATIDAPLVLAGGTFSAGTIINPDNLILASGTLNVTAGDLDVANGQVVDVTSAMTVNVTNGALNVAAGGEFNAINATLDFSSGVNNSGDVNLINSTVNGDLVNGAGGSLALLGSNAFGDDLDLSSSSSLFIDIGGTESGEFDSVTVGGDASLAGALIVALDEDFSLTVGDAFEIADIAGTQTGTFAGLADGAMVGSFGGVDLFIDYDGGDGNDVVLFTLAGSNVDLDNDGDVDGADFLAIQRSNPALIGNWKAQFGSSPPGSAVASTVPEPASALLFLLGCSLAAFNKRTN